MNKNCLICQKGFKVYLSQIRTGRGLYCSQKCHGISKRNKPSLKRTGIFKGCEVCSKHFYVAQWVERRGGAKYCSYTCYWESKIGMTPWNYEGKTTINERIRKSKEYKEWRINVFKRDNYTCVLCGKRGNGTLQADHIKPFAYYPNLRFEATNGRTLCIECHRKTDTYGGRVVNNR